MDVPKKSENIKASRDPPLQSDATYASSSNNRSLREFFPQKVKKIGQTEFYGSGQQHQEEKKFLSKASSSPYRPTSNLAHWNRARATSARAFALSVCLLYTNMYVPPVKTKPPTKFLCKSQPSWKRAEFFFWPACRMVFATDNDIS